MKQLKPYKGKSLYSPERIAKRKLGPFSGFMAKKCRHFYYRTKEAFGQHKRDIVVCRVEDACDSFEDTRIHFDDALERFKAIVLVEYGSLESRYKQLYRQFVISQKMSNAVSERIQAIEEVSDALFTEWELELMQYSNRSLRAQSRQQLKITRQHYGRLIKAMYQAEAKIKPVLSAFRDQVLFLKHNLNAQAIAALQHELVEMSIDVAQLIRAMENSINEANDFVSTLVDYKCLPGST